MFVFEHPPLNLSQRPTSWDVILSTIQLLLLERHSERSVHGNINFIIEVIRKYQLNLSRNIRTL